MIDEATVKNAVKQAILDEQSIGVLDTSYTDTDIGNALASVDVASIINNEAAKIKIENGNVYYDGTLKIANTAEPVDTYVFNAAMRRTREALVGVL